MNKKLVPLILLYMGVILLMCNISAIVDAVIHPEIPYADEEHLIVGGVNGVVSAVLFGLCIVYLTNLKAAMSKIKTLEKVLPICSNCKKIREHDKDPMDSNSWDDLENYINRAVDVEFSHGICPECCDKLYPNSKCGRKHGSEK